MCRRGNASKEAVNFLLQMGITNTVNIEGGINAYSQLDPLIPLY
jgi:rhodanese-related sulfurtransferase